MSCASEKSGERNAILAVEAHHGAQLQSLPAHIAVVDAVGAIKLVNPAWRAFARDNGGRGEAYLGDNYLEVCRKAAAAGRGRRSRPRRRRRRAWRGCS